MTIILERKGQAKSIDNCLDNHHISRTLTALEFVPTMPARNTLHLYLIPIILIAVLFFLFTPYRPYQTGLSVDDDGLLNPASTLNSGMGLGGIEEEDAVDWELEKTLKGVQGNKEMGGDEGEYETEETMDAEQDLRSTKLVQLDLTVMSRCPDAVSNTHLVERRRHSIGPNQETDKTTVSLVFCFSFPSSRTPMQRICEAVIDKVGPLPHNKSFPA